MKISIVSGPESIRSEVILPASKSISNRALIIRSLTGVESNITNLSDADDTVRLQVALHSNSDVWHAGLGGTTARFLISLAAVRGEGVTVDGDEALRKRPVSTLVDALNSLGAVIEYLDKEGCLPVRISETISAGGKLDVDASVSSQFVSALMLIGPCLEGGLALNFKNEALSRSYINMTAIVMRDFGADVKLDENGVHISSSRKKTAAIESVFTKDSIAAVFFLEELIRLSSRYTWLLITSVTHPSIPYLSLTFSFSIFFSELLEKYPPIPFSFIIMAVLEMMRFDKKQVADGIRFCFIPEVGKFRLGTLSDMQVVSSAIRELGQFI